ncbi:aminotransferase class I/II-fold pyridoxal phosphate-dependent enzyme [Streptomyces sp. NPDC050428]|uniref:aminotransferase class I/II-fold pyridoxal phosphate-dependent enzyme n=1 Tax=Streptomyces sp. NPDC050428 TaxID=3155757 RepID=UPI0034209017
MKTIPRQMRQGGDLTGLETTIDLDLSLCANPYGPAPAARTAVNALDFATLIRPPYDAADRFLTAYAKELGVDASELTPGRGVTEFIILTSRILGLLTSRLPGPETPVNHRRRAVAVITPEYSGTISAFHQADLISPPPGEPPSPEGREALVHRAMETHQVVVLSNPSNPEGLYVKSDRLLDIAAGHPSSLMIVDEEYLRFERDAKSLAGTDLDNVVVWQSIGKTFGLVGLRAGVMWTRNELYTKLIRPYVPTWPLSQLDTVASLGALADTAWCDDTLRKIRTDAYLAEILLGQLFGASRVSGTIHFRFVQLDNPTPIAAHLETQGIAVRTFDGRLPGHPSGIRILAPTSADQREQLSDAVNSCPLALHLYAGKLI